MDYAKVGGQIHALTNETLYRKLTLKEYRRLIRLIGSVFADAQRQRTK